MFTDKETFVPGKTTGKPTLTIKFTRAHLEHDYSKASDCPIFHALKDAGLDVRSVGPGRWCSSVGCHEFSPALQKASELLCRTEVMPFGKLIRRWRLQGKEFTVTL